MTAEQRQHFAADHVASRVVIVVVPWLPSQGVNELREEFVEGAPTITDRPGVFHRNRVCNEREASDEYVCCFK